MSPALPDDVAARPAAHAQHVECAAQAEHAGVAELAARVEELERLLAERTAALDEETAARRRAEADLQRADAELRARLHVDGLTGVGNRVRFDTALASMWSHLGRISEPLTLLMIDVDHFKRYNDALGHLAGDECLRAIAGCLTDSVRRPVDVVARYGGEEFAVVLPATGSAGGRVMADRIRARIAVAELAHPASPLGRVTVSIGVATVYPGPGPDPSSLVAEVDAALYNAKAAGRNRIVVSEGGVLVG